MLKSTADIGLVGLRRQVVGKAAPQKLDGLLINRKPLLVFMDHMTND